MSHYKTYPEYKDSGVEWIGEVPVHWAVVPGKALFIEKKRKNTDLAGGDYLSLVAGRGVIPYEEKGDIGNRKPDDLDRCKLVEPGDHVINSMNFSIGAYGRSRFSGVCSPVYVILGENDRKLGEGFGELLLSNPSYQDFIQSFGSGILDHRRSIGWDEIKVAHIPCPPIQEQEEISALVHRETTRIDTLIEKKQRFIELLEEKRQAVITHAVTKGLDPNVPMKDSGVEWIGEVPEGWSNRKVFHAFRTIGSGTTPPSKEHEWYQGGTIPWITTSELKENIVVKTKKCVTPDAMKKFSALKIFPTGSLVVAMYGATIGRLGLLGIPATTNQACCVLSGERDLNIQFLYYWLMAFRADIVALFSEGGGQPNINQEVIASLWVPSPGPDEQATIATTLDRETTRIDTLIEKTRESIELLKERRSALITAAVTGKIDVREEAA